jgi:TonB-dependent receptor
MLRSVLLSLSLVTLTVLGAAAQSGTVKGAIKDGISGDPIIGANVIIAGTGLGAVADAEGNFEIPKVKVGSYNLIISFISYKSDTLKNITVYPDQVTLINTTLVEESAQLTEVVISGERVRNTDVAIISDIKSAQLVVSGISAQQISMSQDRDAAQIVKRIPGVTIVGNRFVNVRGLSERYTSVLLNGVIAPSTEVDSRAFAFDLIPSSMIDRMLVYKSGGANLPGDFAGAVIDVGTKNVVGEDELTVNVTGGVRVGTTFKDFYTSPGSNTDWLGFDNNYRSLPGSFPTQSLTDFTRDLSQYRNRKADGEAGASLNNEWQTKKGTAAPDFRTTINYARSGYIGDKRFGNITSISYSNTRQHLEQTNNFYEAYNPATGEVGTRYAYKDQRDAVNVRLGIISNFMFEFNPSNKIEFRNFYNQQGTDQTTIRGGQEIVQNFDVHNTGMTYTERAIYSGQLAGKHSLNDHLNLNWTFGYGSTSANQPDTRRIRSQKTLGTEAPFSVNISSNANAADGRFFSELNEEVYTHALDVEYKLNPEADEKKQAKISAGYYLSQTERDFSARWFSYNWFPGITPNLELLTQPYNTIFVRDNLINPEDRAGSQTANPLFKFEEGTTLSDKYTAENLYTAGYVNFFIPVSAFKFAVGSRVEYNRQQLSSHDDKGPIEVDNPITSFLPFVNISYDLNEKSLIRLAYSKTLNRPVFREIAPFNYYDWERAANFHGNDSLKIADIHNVDLRFENYPTKNEMISFGVFYKYFKNPIEMLLEQGSNIIYTFGNGESATSYGAEFEVRKSLQEFTSSGFINKLNVTFNATVIKSEVTLSDKFSNQEKNRAMQGQSPYVINAGLNYVDQENTFQVNLAYNVFGERIFAVGDLNPATGYPNNAATQYEMPRNQIDLTISKGLGQRFEIKGGVQDLLNQRYRIIQDSNSTQKIDGSDDDIQGYKPGQYITLGVTYRLK